MQFEPFCRTRPTQPPTMNCTCYSRSSLVIRTSFGFIRTLGEMTPSSGFTFGVVGIGTRAAGKANVMNTHSRSSYSDSATARAQQGRETRMSQEGACGCGRDSASSEIGFTLRRLFYFTEAGSGTDALGMRALGGLGRTAIGTPGRAGFGRRVASSALMARCVSPPKSIFLMAVNVMFYNVLLVRVKPVDEPGELSGGPGH